MESNKKTLYLIQGIYFYESSTAEIAYRPIVGAEAVLSHGAFFSLFSGLIAPFINDETKYGGFLSDYFGESTLMNVKISDDKLSFQKKYNETGWVLFYKFKKVDGLWLGQYTGKGIKPGYAKCVINKIDESFFAKDE